MKKTIPNLLATAAAGLLIGASTGCTSEVSTNETAPAQAPGQPSPGVASDVHACKGQNDCAGKGGCKSSDNGCRGKNSCKSKGGCSTKAKH